MVVSMEPLGIASSRVESQYLQSKVSVAVFTGFAADGLPGFNVSLREGLGLRVYGCLALFRVSV